MKKLILTLLLPLMLSGCAEDFLEIRRDKRQVIPTTIADCQSILDNTTIMNLSSSLTLNVIGGEEYTVTNDVWDLLTANTQKNAYIWKADIFEGAESDDWNNGYKKIFYANTALDRLNRIEPQQTELNAWRQAKGIALFHRSYAFYQLAQTFCKAYDSQTAATDAGIPLRLEADITLPVSRASVAAVYNQITKDLQEAATLLPITTDSKFRPSKAAAYGLLVKTKMHQQDYAQAIKYADSCLTYSPALLNYNTVNTTLRYTFGDKLYGEGNPEVLYFEAIPSPTIVNATRFILNQDLYNSYEVNDIRRTAFFFPTRGTYTFKGSYSGLYGFFSGIASDEIVLARAEAYARKDNLTDALTDLNYLLRNRYRTTNFIAYNTTDKTQLINRLLLERRKQLLCRGIRWEDLRRLNKEASTAITLSRDLKGVAYSLTPEDPKYIWPIPDNVINLSNIIQNPR